MIEKATESTTVEVVKVSVETPQQRVYTQGKPVHWMVTLPTSTVCMGTNKMNQLIQPKLAVFWHSKKCTVSRFVPLPLSYANQRCPRCGIDQLVGAIIVNRIGQLVIDGTDVVDANIICMACKWVGDSIGD